MRGNIVFKVFLFNVLIFILYGCGAISGYNEYSSYDGDYLSNKQLAEEGPLSRWELHTIKVNGKEIVNIQKKNYITLTFWENNRFSGYSGCNSFSGHIDIKNDLVRFKEFFATSRGCLGNPSIETIIFDALKNVNNYYVEKGQLYLKCNNEILIVYSKDNSNNN